MPATRALAYMSVVGAVSREMLIDLDPSCEKKRQTDVLDSYVDAGILVRYDILGLRGHPRIWNFNQKHGSWGGFRQLCRAIWDHYLENRFGPQKPSPYIIPSVKHVRRSGGPAILESEPYRLRGRVLHLLAEVDGPVLQAIGERMLGGSHGGFIRSVNALVALGLVADRYENLDRVLQLNGSHPIIPTLRLWLRHVNKTGFPDYVELATQYHDRLAAGEYTRTFRVKAGHERNRRMHRVPNVAETGLLGET